MAGGVGVDAESGRDGRVVGRFQQSAAQFEHLPVRVLEIFEVEIEMDLLG